MKRREGPGLSRRELLREGASVTVGCAFGLAMAGCERKPELVCSTPDDLTDAEMALRESVSYAEESRVEGQACGNCGFFTAAAPGTCGTCKLLKGPVNPRGHCTSWSATS